MTEPRWIAYELHDGLMQWVIGARMHVASLVAALDEQRPIENLHGDLRHVLNFLNLATEEARHLIGFVEGLESSDTSDVVEALAASCEMMVRKVRQGEPQLEFLPPAEPWPKLTPPQAWSMVRIAQQAAINALRHSGGQSVVVRMLTQPESLCIEVSDDGRGFDPQAEFPGHFGLKSMRQRAREAGYRLEIHSSSSGTRVTLTAPRIAPSIAPSIA